jgi:BNR repeat protein
VAGPPIPGQAPGRGPAPARGATPGRGPVAAALVVGLLVVATALASWESLLIRDAGVPRRTPGTSVASGSPRASGSPSLGPSGSGRPSATPVGSVRPSPSSTDASGDVTVSGTSAFGLCPLPGQGRTYTNAEVEPWLAVDPADPENLIAVWQQDRSSAGAARAIVAGYSRDGGRAWRRTPAPFGSCATFRPPGGAVYERVSDPWVSCGPRGTCFASGLGVSEGGLSGVLVSRSTDGGRTWAAARRIDGSDRTLGFDDKESITADPTDPNVVYVVWDRTVGSGQGGTPRRGPDPPDEIRFARSLDAGLTWEEPRVIGRVAGTPLGNQIAVLPDGTLLNVFEVAQPGVAGSVGSLQQVIRSMDRGLTWSAPITIATVRGAQVRDPVSGQRVRSGEGLPDVAVDRLTGLVVAVWTDTRFSGASTTDVALSLSSDGGQSWSSVRKANQTPVAASAFTPSVEIDARGAIGVTYYDLRNDTRAGPLLTDYFLARSADAGATWRETRLTDSSFDLALAPQADGYFLGDYMGLAATSERFVSAFVVTNPTPSDPTRVVVRAAP